MCRHPLRRLFAEIRISNKEQFERGVQVGRRWSRLARSRQSLLEWGARPGEEVQVRS